MPDGWNVVLDIDLLLINSIKQELEYSFKNLKQIAAYSDAIHCMNCKFSSSFMVFRSGSLRDIYENFLTSYPTIENYLGGDQVWIGPQLTNVLYIDEKFPNFKRSLKFNLSKRDGNTLHIPLEITEDIKIIDFHGRPKPHEIATVPFVAENWR